ncbi:DUF1203 domain-containing protein [Spongiactinospora sp. TRM90649]|uniref:DUF1203 domain-containing protein n=1 Tax=Spongiactinospora sp. TRM90649 TaxID=3031114 RepID=UPI0023F789BA|nr:DUF1203 domain-containing protein [Spongiactinospora sp. TRM90649]MDF5756690.1 DUF1203 domain-containing protein [Spongiactinospora sp. TRM90649]
MTTDIASAAIVIRAIEPEVVAGLLRRDDAGREPRPMVCADGGSPLRCCLGRSVPGEEIALVSYAPLRRWARETGADPGAYDEVGPVFVHAGPCPGPPSEPGFPPKMGGELRVLRTYGADGRILGGHLAAGHLTTDPRTATGLLAGRFADPRVAVVHVRAVEFGCFLFEARRAP